jgi:hypothetical protein
MMMIVRFSPVSPPHTYLLLLLVLLLMYFTFSRALSRHKNWWKKAGRVGIESVTQTKLSSS